ncbi:MAG TPA: nitrile hydratase subunit beta [Rhodobacteraceae bacterium]|nr:nitrile hydratase subunit beta [Paracoccaceae bacterium]
MTRAHDLGGRPAGPVPDTDDAVVFHNSWHAKALALNLACGALGAWNIDASRFAREQLKDHASLSYYEKWMAGLSNLLVERGLVTEAELSGDSPQSKLTPKALRAADVSAAMHKVMPYARNNGPAPQFHVGDNVRTLPAPQAGHCRLPAYAAGRVGTVILSHGNHVFPGSNARFQGENPQPLYTVEFSAATLWGEAAENPDDAISLDLWQPYLEPL